MLSGRSSCGTKSKILRINKVISYSLMSVYSRLEATRKVLGQIKKANVMIEDRTGKQPCQAVCAAVCKCHGLLNIEVTDFSFT